LGGLRFAGIADGDDDEDDDDGKVESEDGDVDDVEDDDEDESWCPISRYGDYVNICLWCRCPG
jgi:hypothetical protein